MGLFIAFVWRMHSLLGAGEVALVVVRGDSWEKMNNLGECFLYRAFWFYYYKLYERKRGRRRGQGQLVPFIHLSHLI